MSNTCCDRTNLKTCCIMAISVVALALQWGCNKKSDLYVVGEIKPIVNETNMDQRCIVDLVDARLGAAFWPLKTVATSLQLSKSWHISEDDAALRLHNKLFLVPKDDGTIGVGLNDPEIDTNLAVQIVSRLMDHEDVKRTRETSSVCFDKTGKARTNSVNLGLNFVLKPGYMRVDRLKIRNPEIEELRGAPIFIGLLIISLAKVVFFVGYVWLVVVGFKTSFMWGLLNLIPLPFSLVFCFVHWAKARRPLFVCLVGLLLVAVGLAYLFFSGVPYGRPGF